MSEVLWKDLPVNQWTSHLQSAADVDRLRTFLEEQGTFEFPSLSNGLFSAAAGHGDDFEVTGYTNIWVRDNIHIAYAQWTALNAPQNAVKCLASIFEFFTKHLHKFDNIISGRTSASDPMNRPHIRFNGTTLEELPEKWSHAQNDALGYSLWLFSLLTEQSIFVPSADDWNVVSALIHYWQKIEVWSDEDSGHWEETRKISASSIGTALAGLQALERLIRFSTPAADALRSAAYPVSNRNINDLIRNCHQALSQILPFECRQDSSDKLRAYDAALLFLIFPLNVVPPIVADQIITNTILHLEGPYGIRRYQGDSYWCANYKKLLDASVRTSDFSDSLSERDKLLIPGKEAQWCIFDPILSCVFGSRFRTLQRPEDFDAQRYRLQRSLNQMTHPETRFPRFRCPESWYFENSHWGPNDITPLLWTQANLLQALKSMESSLNIRDSAANRL